MLKPKKKGKYMKYYNLKLMMVRFFLTGVFNRHFTQLKH